MKIKGYGDDVEILWTDKKRYFGMPISFTRYAIINKPGLWTKVVRIKGLFSTDVEEVHVYRIDDVGVFQSLADKMFGVGTLDVYCKDASCDVLKFEQVKNPMRVKALLSDLVEKERAKKGMRYAEMSSDYSY